MLNLEALLGLYGFGPDVPTKLVRHQDTRWDVEMLRRDGFFEAYQSFQADLSSGTASG